jgi:hypothetical protein
MPNNCTFCSISRPDWLTSVRWAVRAPIQMYSTSIHLRSRDELIVNDIA